MYNDQRTAFPVDNGKIVRVCGPFEVILACLEPLQLHSQKTLVDLRVGEGTKMASQPEPTAHGDEPFSGIILVPFHSISVIHWELMMEIVITLPES